MNRVAYRLVDHRASTKGERDEPKEPDTSAKVASRQKRSVANSVWEEPDYSVAIDNALAMQRLTAV